MHCLKPLLQVKMPPNKNVCVTDSVFLARRQFGSLVPSKVEQMSQTLPFCGGEEGTPFRTQRPLPHTLPLPGCEPAPRAETAGRLTPPSKGPACGCGDPSDGANTWAGAAARGRKTQVRGCSRNHRARPGLAETHHCPKERSSVNATWPMASSS